MSWIQLICIFSGITAEKRLSSRNWLTGGVRLPTIIVFSYLCLAMLVSTLAISLSKPGCGEKCGKVTIPYPFGIGSRCSANSYFTIICQNYTKPILSQCNHLLLGTITVNQPVSPMNCSKVQRRGSLSTSLEDSPLSISAGYNTSVVLGCKHSVWLVVNETIRGGCTALCSANSTDTTCNGVNCCQTTIPTRPLKWRADGLREKGESRLVLGEETGNFW